jgi:hypothetical protein
MKKTIKTFAIVILICLSIIAGLSMINVNMVQHQKQNQNQITKQYNTQLTIVGTHKRIKNIVWKTESFKSSAELAEFYNTKLDLFQQRESKVFMRGHGYALIKVLYPVINSTEVNVYTNEQIQGQMQTNDIDFNLFEKIKSLF